MNFSGDLLSNDSRPILIRPHESAVYYSIVESDIPAQLDCKESFIYGTLASDGKIISENALYFDLPKNLKLSQPERT